MPFKPPWHSKILHVYHNNSACTTGSKIESNNLVRGTGGHPLCKECAECTRQRK